ncbi:DUF4349 domain-containing protein [uncultured Sunxiuqinia sp.]|uniref:DUF4349 domain-containing protein n=1 Tax=uncultured Sunxiuqinia sp. TaxID=1573825 RepID=UPI002637A777|nr:DUF4349 domain-containing protein [uncultured Sunxiuqinia sp.]
MKTFMSFTFLLLFMISCNLQQHDQAVYELADTEQAIMPVAKQELNSSPATPLPEQATQEVVKKRIIKDGRLGLKVNDLEAAKTRTDTTVKAFGGYYANERFNNSEWESSYNLTIRIPSAHFEDFIAALEQGNGEVQYKAIDARDVTARFIDLETRLENKQNYLNRYQDLLKQAQNVKEILEIEEKIRGLEEEIESTTGQLKYLNDQVDYSTLDLELTKQRAYKYTPANRDKFFERFKQSLSKGWYVFVDFTLLMIKLWPFWIIVFVFRHFWKKFRKNRKEK